MRTRVRWIIVGAVALCGIGLVVLGMDEGRALLVIGEVPPEQLGQQLAWTVLPLVVGLGTLVWCLTAGRTWARRQCQPPAVGHPRLR
jgi:hypothetical protein